MNTTLPCPFCNKQFELDAWVNHLDKHDGSTGAMTGGNLPVNAIRTDAGTQSRVSINTGTVKEYAEAMDAGDKFPAINVFYDRESKTFILVDGFHRLQAAKSLQRETFEATIRFGTLREAVLVSKGANPHHGLSRTSADKRKVVTEMLQDPEWVKWSDREIAEKCVVSHTLVANIRRELAPVTGNVASSDKITRTYKTKDGNVASMRTGKIGGGQKRQKSEDTYQDDVPAVEVDAVGAGSDTSRPAVTLPPSVTSVSTALPSSSRANTPPGHTKPGHDDGYASGFTPQGGEPPRAALHANGRYSLHVDANGVQSIVDERGCALSLYECVTVMNMKAGSQVVKTVEVAAPEPTLEVVAKALDISDSDIIDLASEHTPKVITYLAKAIEAAPERLEKPYEALMLMAMKLRDAKRVKGSKKADKPVSNHRDLFGAICQQFGYAAKLTTPERTRIGKVAKELAEVGADVLDIGGLYRYCKMNYDTFTENAFLTNWSAYRASDYHLKAHTRLVPDDAPVIQRERPIQDFELEPIPATGEERAKRAEEIFQQVVAMKSVRLQNQAS